MSSLSKSGILKLLLLIFNLIEISLCYYNIGNLRLNVRYEEEWEN